MASIQPTLFIAMILANLFVVRLVAVILPDELYFTFSAFLFNNQDLFKIYALAAKLAIPFVTSFVAMVLLDRSARAQEAVHGPAAKLPLVLRDQAPITMAYAAATTALLLAWPYILLWDLLIDPALARHRIIFLAAYISYTVGYGFFALSGAQTAAVFMTRETSSEPLTFKTLSSSPVVRPFYDALSGTVATAIATFLATRAI